MSFQFLALRSQESLDFKAQLAQLQDPKRALRFSFNANIDFQNWVNMSDAAPISVAATSFEAAWRSLANSRLLPFALLAIGTVSNVAYAHTPLVAFAVMSGTLLPRRRALAVAVLIWLVNQGVGFGWRGYPLADSAFIWGGLMGLGTFLVAMFASWRPGIARTSWLGHWLWWAIALLVGFGLYQGPILLAYPLLADGHWITGAIVLKLLWKQTVWAGAIAMAYGLLLWRQLTAAPLSQTRP
ncbi:MAG: hypothetical protein AAF722_13215 [Cyanobacteria bacterium P01_C01_bin.70]